MDKSYADLLKENDLLKKENDKKDRIIEKLQKTVEELALKVKQLNNELRKYVNENTPSGAIPSYMKKKLENTVEKYSKISEDNKSEPKENNRNARSSHIDRQDYHSIEDPHCPKCGGEARRRGKSTRKRIVIHIQLPKFENVEHESEIYQCSDCGKIFDAPVPDTLPKAEFDITTMVLISYLYTATNMTISNIVALFGSFGLNISEGSVTNTLKRLKYYLGPYHEELLGKVKAANARYKDETSHRHNGKNFWAWVVATKEWAYYTIEKQRSHKVAKKLASNHGTDVVDGYAGYNGLSDIQRDWSHSLRRAKNPLYDFGNGESYKEYKLFVKKLSLLFHDGKIAKKNNDVSNKLRKTYDDKLWKLLQSAPTEGKNFKRLINYIMKFDGERFTFLQYKEVDPTSNLAERMLRPMVIKRRVSQQSRGMDNMNSYAMQMSMYMTSKLQGQNYMENLLNILRSDFPSKP